MRARAADLSTELGIPVNQVSFHLRQLAKYGLVEEAVGEGRDRRDRVWRLVDDTGLNLDLRAMEQQPGGLAATAVFRSQSAAWAHALVDGAYGPTPSEEVQRTVIDQTVRLTKDEAEEMSQELSEVLQRWTERTRGRAADRRTYSTLVMVQPLPDHRAAGDDT